MTTPSAAEIEHPSAGDSIEPDCAIIEVHLGDPKQLFNSIDPSPFHDKDLDPRTEEFIVGWAKDLPRDARLALLIHLDRQAGLPDESVILENAIHQFFRRRAQASRQRLRELFRVGRTSLTIGLLCLASSLAIGDFVAAWLKGRIGEILRESLLIGGWVSMWRPLEIFLYDWWPIRDDARLYDRLAQMPVGIRYIGDSSEAWHQDWPAVPASRKSVNREPYTDPHVKGGKQMLE